MNSLEKTLEETDAGNGKQYIFLYPVREYFESMLNFCKTFYKEGHSVDKLNDIITSRYRSKGYGIVRMDFKGKEFRVLCQKKVNEG